MKKYEMKRENRMKYRDILLETTKKEFDFNLVELEDIEKLKGIMFHPQEDLFKDKLNLIGLVENDVNKHLYNRVFDGRYSQFLVTKEVYKSLIKNSREVVLEIEGIGWSKSTKLVVREMI